MKTMIAACGIDCAKCNALIASKTNDDELRKKTAAEWTKAYGFPFETGMINCHGCFATDGVQIGHCADCEMRKCSLGKGLSNCASCADYPCKTVADFHAVCPEAKENLKAFRA